MSAKAGTVEAARLRAWSFRRQLLAEPVAEPLDALRRVVAVYSAHPSGPLALHARSAPFDAAAFGGLEQRRRAVRIAGMRGSAFLVPLDFADRIVAATRDGAGPSAARLRARGLDEATYRSLRPRILGALTEPSTPAQLARALGVDPSDRAAYFGMRLLAREGLVLRVGTGRIRTDDLRWVATDAWLGRPLGDVDPDEALRWLAGAYLEGYGPATVEDFAWWAGVRGKRAAAAMATVPTIEVGAGLLLPAESGAAWEACRQLDPAAVAVVPKWDPYTMAYRPAGRDRFVEPRHLALAYSTAQTRVGATTGDGLPLILVGGLAVASWSVRLAGARIHVDVRPFEPSAAGKALLERIEPAFARIGAFFDGSVALDVVPT